MAKYEWSEVFMSIEGEARYSGHPTVYVRFARCNFQCRAFNNPNLEVESDGYAVLGFNPADYKTLESIPLVHKGCDSQYAVNPKFAHMWHKGDEKELAAEVLNVLPYNTFQNPKSGKRVILSLTGGEPTIRLKFWIPLLEELYNHGMRDVLIETNCSAPMRDKDIAALYDWANEKNEADQFGVPAFGKDPVKFIWSNSPKLASSGETREDAIRPRIAMQQLKWVYSGDQPTRSRAGAVPPLEQYFKFVCGPSDEDFAEVESAMKAYITEGVSPKVDVYIMPMACTEEQQQEVAAKVAHMCMERGYIYCHRIQNSVFGNGVGT